jgi:hypothetical protein
VFMAQAEKQSPENLGKVDIPAGGVTNDACVTAVTALTGRLLSGMDSTILVPRNSGLKEFLIHTGIPCSMAGRMAFRWMTLAP